MIALPGAAVVRGVQGISEMFGRKGHIGGKWTQIGEIGLGRKTKAQPRWFPPK